MAMMTWMRRTSRYFLAVVVLAFIASLAYFGAPQDKSNPATVATVNGEEISAATYDRAYRATVEQYRQIFRDRFSEDLVRSLRLQDQGIDRLVTDRLKLQGLTPDGVKVSEAEVRQYWESRQARVRAAYLLVSPEAFVPGAEAGDAQIEAYYKGHQAEFTRPERRRVLAALLPTASVPAPAVPDADVEAAYQERRGEFEQPERRK